MNDIKFKNEFYKDILNRILERVPNASNRQIIIWKKQIKQLFLKGFLIKEILSALSAAFQRSKWNMPFFKRVERIILEQRKDEEFKPKFKEDKMELLANIFQRYKI